MTAPKWISAQLAKAIHDDQIAQHGGSLGLRDENLFLASLDRAQNLFAYGESPTLFDLASAYAYGIAKNHPFIDGNKRTAFVVMAVFLELNGYTFAAPEMDVVIMMERLATDLEDQRSISIWLQKNSIELEAI
jgi:death on curing protein